MAAHLARMQSGREGDGAVGHHLAAADRDGDRADGLAGILHDDSSPQRGALTAVGGTAPARTVARRGRWSSGARTTAAERVYGAKRHDVVPPAPARQDRAAGALRHERTQRGSQP